MQGWWAGRVRQFGRHLLGRVSPAERRELERWLTPAQATLFRAMHPADRRHGLDVVASLRAAGHAEPDLLLAGLFHDAGKGPAVGLWHRVAWTLGERYGESVLGIAARLPGFRPALARIRDHAEISAAMALRAGCAPLTAELIRTAGSTHAEEATPVGADMALGAADARRLSRALRLADEAS